MAHSARFWNRIANKYSKSPIANEEAYQKKLEISRSYFNPDMHVLEIGCGTGGTALSHSPYVKQIRAIDISDKMLSIASDKQHSMGVNNVEFIQGDISALNESPEHYDAVLALSFLHLVEDIHESLAVLRRVLKTNGVFISSTVCLGNSMPYFRYIAPIGYFLGALPLLKVYKEDDLKRFIETAGFKIERYWKPEAGSSVFIVARKTEE